MLIELHQRYLEEITPQKKGAEPEAARIRALLKNPLTQRIVAGIRGVDIARYRDERLRKVCPGTVKRDLMIISHLLEIARKEWSVHVQNPVRDSKLPPHAKARERRLEAAREGEVFPGLTTEAVKRSFIRARHRAGLEDLRFHDLRHETTTRLFEKGLNIMEGACVTGHKDLRMLHRYTHLKAEDLARRLG